ncbi:MAG: molybdopterin-dependent oxidoreductase [Anaerolineae bacterium]|nr:molybdopterin-dependent oxidoreductase [Anaerolineae bacterium]
MQENAPEIIREAVQAHVEKKRIQDEAATQASVAAVSRREFLIQLGSTSAVLTLVGTGMAAVIQTFTEEEIVGGDVDISGLRNEAVLIEPAPGTRPEYTPLEDHYRIDISVGGGPNISEEDWRLRVTGLVDNEVALSLAELRENYTPMNAIITMSCISNRIAGDLISTTQWTGFSAQELLETVQPRPEATHMRITSGDGFHEVVALDLVREDPRVMFAYAWDDVPLPRRHGFPLRIHIPDRYGMKQPKWIEEIEFIDEWRAGYWVQRGWSREAIVRATSVIDTVAVDSIYEENGTEYVPIGGIAFAGARGISRVEVRIDGGEWVPAQIRTPLSDRSWVIWRYDWAFTEGRHEFQVRMFEGDGTAQIETPASTRPDGATGIHTINETL